jgi:hypothetical protein
VSEVRPIPAAVTLHWQEQRINELVAELAALKSERDRLVKVLRLLSDAAEHHGGSISLSAWKVVRALLARIDAREKP